jgi:PAS domain S-box-containing protein
MPKKKDTTVASTYAHLLNSFKENPLKYAEFMNIIIVVLSTDQKVVYINEKGSKVLGCPKDQIIGKNWFDNFLPKKMVKDVKEVFNKLMKGEVDSSEFYRNPIINRSGEERIILWRNTLLKDKKGKIIGAISTGDDITDQKELEKELKEQMKEQMKELTK